jgi:hypothetical protein
VELEAKGEREVGGKSEADVKEGLAEARVKV